MLFLRLFIFLSLLFNYVYMLAFLRSWFFESKRWILSYKDVKSDHMSSLQVIYRLTDSFNEKWNFRTSSIDHQAGIKTRVAMYVENNFIVFFSTA